MDKISVARATSKLTCHQLHRVLTSTPPAVLHSHPGCLPQLLGFKNQHNTRALSRFPTLAIIREYDAILNSIDSSSRRKCSFPPHNPRVNIHPMLNLIYRRIRFGTLRPQHSPSLHSPPVAQHPNHSHPPRSRRISIQVHSQTSSLTPRDSGPLLFPH